MKLSEVAKIMYDLQEYCNYLADYNCEVCLFGNKDCGMGTDKIPGDWDITLSDIERLECEGR